MPIPFHPVIVHFPIAFLLLGAVGAVAAVVFRRLYLPHYTALMLILGTAGIWMALSTGNQDAAGRGLIDPEANLVLTQHQKMAANTSQAATLAAALAFVSALLTGLFPKIARLLAIVVAALAITAGVFVAQTAHLGMRFVYEYEIGIKR